MKRTDAKSEFIVVID